MSIFQPVLVTRVVFILGMVNLVTVLSIFLSCRCIPGMKVAGKLMKYPAYRRFCKYHCYIWWVFWPSVVVHAIFAISLIGVPF
ncbi:MAG: hypothetical protein Q8O05_04845 [Chloroflexota bacterium]|nr:hypothetical protein [Chloroflexota bacterium]